MVSGYLALPYWNSSPCLPCKVSIDLQCVQRGFNLLGCKNKPSAYQGPARSEHAQFDKHMLRTQNPVVPARDFRHSSTCCRSQERLCLTALPGQRLPAPSLGSARTGAASVQILGLGRGSTALKGEIWEAHFHSGPLEARTWVK